MKKSEMRQIILAEMAKQPTNRQFEIQDIVQAASYQCSEIGFELVADTFNRVIEFQSQGQQQFENRLEAVRISGATAYQFVR